MKPSQAIVWLCAVGALIYMALTYGLLNALALLMLAVLVAVTVEAIR